MMKKLTQYLLFILCSIVTFVGVASATVQVSSNGDLVTVKGTNPTGIGFYYNTSSSYNTAKSFAKTGYVTSGTGQISLKNGSYYFWSINSAGGLQSYGPYTVSGSCKNDATKTNMTGTFTVERCYIKSASGTNAESSGTMATCANGYYLDQNKLSVVSNGCKGINLGNLKQRYCKVVVQATCAKKSGSESGGDSGGSSGGSSGGGSSKKTVAAAKLSSLSVSNGSLSPAFKSGTKKYNVSVDSSVTSVYIDASVSGGSFVNNYGPRDVDLSYGSNTAQIKVKNSAGKVTTYTVYINRADGRSGVNTLSNMTINPGTLSPAFSSTIKDYTVNVGYDTESITIDATLTDNNSKFLSGYGPSSYQLSPGNNVINIKIQSEKGEVNVYSVNVIRESVPSECTTNTEELALLKGVDLSVDNPNVVVDQIEDFDPYTTTYENIKVANEVTSLTITPLTMDEADMDSVKIEGNGDLEVDIPKQITISVTSKKCPNYTRTYTLNVTRKPVHEPSSIADLEDIQIDGHDDFKFEPNELKYGLVLNKGETSLNIHLVKKDESTECVIEGNEELKNGSVVKITCTAEDEVEKRPYEIKITGVRKGTSAILIFIIIVLIILLLIYLLLRLLGYKIYFNFAVIGAFFRGLGEKIKNIFDK